MGRLIDANKLLENQYRIDDSATLSTRDVVNVEDIKDAPTVEAIPKSDYENRLKADMVAMLTEIKKEIDEIPINADNSEPFKLGQASAYDKCENLIQQKINALKENKDEV